MGHFGGGVLSERRGHGGAGGGGVTPFVRGYEVNMWAIEQLVRDTFENTSFTKCEFIFILFIFYALFCSLSQNKPGRQEVPFVVLGHILVTFSLVFDQQTSNWGFFQVALI